MNSITDNVKPEIEKNIIINYTQIENSINILRICSHSRWIFIYWLENVYSGYLNYEKQSIINDQKNIYSGWIITTAGYYDKSIYGNWKGDEINGTVPNETKIVNRQQILESSNFKKFIKCLYDIVINRTNLRISLKDTRNDSFNYKLDYELDLFKKYIYPDNIPNVLNHRNEIGHNIYIDNNDTFKLCKDKDVVVINLYADLIRDHYKSGKVTEWYTKLSGYNNCIIPSIKSISSIETPYPFGNGINEETYNNFFETLEYIKQKIDKHPYNYDIALISAGIYTSFIADYINKHKNKEFICYGRDLNDIFCIKYKNTYTWCHCDYTLANISSYLCDIPNKYRLPNYEYIENGCYW